MPQSPTSLSAPRRTFHDVLRGGRFKFSERELMAHLGLNYRGLKMREADPSRLSIAELLRVADLVAEPVEDIIAIVLAEVRARHTPDAPK